MISERYQVPHFGQTHLELQLKTGKAEELESESCFHCWHCYHCLIETRKMPTTDAQMITDAQIREQCAKQLIPVLTSVGTSEQYLPQLLVIDQ